MSATATMTLTAPATQPPAPRGAEWLELAVAAERLRKSVGHVARLCQQWAVNKLAEKRTPKDGGKPSWHIRSDAHVLLGPAPAPEHLPFNDSALTAAQRSQLDQAERLLTEWSNRLDARHDLGLTEEMVTARLLAEIEERDKVRISRTTLYRWRRDYRQRGRAGLVDDRWTQGDKESGDPFKDFYEEIKSWWLDQNQPGKAACYKIACAIAAKRGWHTPTYRSACRFLENLPRSIVVRNRLGKEAHNNLCAPFHERDYTGLHSNQIWCGDHHPCDVIITHNGKHCRPWMTAWQDMRSRKIVGVVIFAHDPNSTTVLAAFRVGCLSHGVPDQVYIDNGKDYDCYALQGITKAERQRLPLLKEEVRFAWDQQTKGGIFGGMRVTVAHAPPYHPQSKPVERFFRSFEDGFGKFQRTYCGNKPDAKPEWLPDRLERGEAPTLEEYAAGALEWIEREYHARTHEGQGMDRVHGDDKPGPQLTPGEMFDQALVRKRTTTADELKLHLTLPSKPIKVGRNGVTYAGRTYGQGEPLLMGEWLGKMVVLRTDPDDVNNCHVWTPEGKFICLVSKNGLVPFKATDAEYRQASRQLNRAKKVHAESILSRPMRMVGDPAEQIYANRAAESRRRKEAGEAPPPPAAPSILPMQSPLSDGLKDLQRTMERRDQQAALRPAVGAEADSFGAIGDALAAQRRADDEDEGGDAFSQLTHAMRIHGGDE